MNREDTLEARIGVLLEFVEKVCGGSSDERVQTIAKKLVAAKGEVEKAGGLRVPVAWAVDTEFGRGYVFAEELLNAFPQIPQTNGMPTAQEVFAAFDEAMESDKRNVWTGAHLAPRCVRAEKWRKVNELRTRMVNAMEAAEKAKPPHTCKFCGAPSWLDPSEQTAPPDYCHESDHGEPEPTDG